jgi:hypothetical protein
MLTNTKIALCVAILLSAAPAALASTQSKQVHISRSAAAARAMVPTNQVRHSSSLSFDVYDSKGHYVGSDPDSRIRMELLRDPSMGGE